MSAFVDDAFLWANRQRCEEMTRMLLHDYTSLHETVGIKSYSKKSGFFAWQWHVKNEATLLKQTNKEVRAYE